MKIYLENTKPKTSSKKEIQWDALVEVSKQSVDNHPILITRYLARHAGRELNVDPAQYAQG